MRGRGGRRDEEVGGKEGEREGEREEKGKGKEGRREREGGLPHFLFVALRQYKMQEWKTLVVVRGGWGREGGGKREGRRERVTHM